MTFVIAHLSDTHFGGPAAAGDRTRAAIAHLLAMKPRPDVLLVTGDIADHGRPEEYDQARSAFAAWPGPIVIGTGNHDVRDAFARELLGREADGPLDQLLETDRARFLVLDSLVSAPPGERIDHGELAPESLAWLDAELAADDRPTFVALHHPPVDIGLGLMAPILLRDPEALAAVVERHPHVVATMVGHAHTSCATTYAGRPLLIGGGIASTVPYDAEALPVVWVAAPPSFALHLFHDDGRLTTHWRAL